MEKVDNTLKENSRLLSSILSSMGNKESSEDCAKDCFSCLPLQTINDMEDFEEYLRSSDNFKKMVCFTFIQTTKSVKNMYPNYKFS